MDIKGQLTALATSKPLLRTKLWQSLILSEMFYFFLFTYQTPTLPIKPSSNDPITIQPFKAICSESYGGSTEPLPAVHHEILQIKH